MIARARSIPARFRRFRIATLMALVAIVALGAAAARHEARRRQIRDDQALGRLDTLLRALPPDARLSCWGPFPPVPAGSGIGYFEYGEDALADPDPAEPGP